jgi:hypothetical protein
VHSTILATNGYGLKIAWQCFLKLYGCRANRSHILCRWSLYRWVTGRWVRPHMAVAQCQRANGRRAPSERTSVFHGVQITNSTRARTAAEMRLEKARGKSQATCIWQKLCSLHRYCITFFTVHNTTQWSYGRIIGLSLLVK